MASICSIVCAFSEKVQIKLYRLKIDQEMKELKQSKGRDTKKYQIQDSMI